MMSTTQRQGELLRFIGRYMEMHAGTAPCFEEMATAMGLGSKSGIHRLLKGLEERRLIRRLHRRDRSIEIIAPVSGSEDRKVRASAAFYAMQDASIEAGKHGTFLSDRTLIEIIAKHI